MNLFNSLISVKRRQLVRHAYISGSDAIPLQLENDLRATHRMLEGHMPPAGLRLRTTGLDSSEMIAQKSQRHVFIYKKVNSFKEPR